MARISEIKKKAKNGLEVTLVSPGPGAGAEILDVVKLIMARSKHLVTEPDELRFTVEQEDELLGAYLASSDQVIIAPMVGGKIVGMMDFRPGSRRRNSHQGEFGMSVHPDYQGIGIGRMMLEALIAWAEGCLTIETLRLKVHSRNLPAMGLYRALGFIEEGREVRGVKFSDGTYDDVVLMARVV
jgi:RimJ/RimL family protein N-acetyltransferase